MAKEKKVEQITNLEDDFAQWYTDICRKAELVEYASVKGFTILRPYGFAIWENMQRLMDAEFKKTGHENVAMPVLIPESLLKKEGELVNGFAPEVAWVTMGGSEKLEERLAFRPTSETMFCDHWSRVLQTYRQLPMLYNQWCSVVRWEKSTRPFLRTAEFLWQEGHTAHATREEAEVETKKMLGVYEKFAQEYMAMPVICGKKTEGEKVPGAVETYCIEAMMQDRKALQAGTSHFLGQNFAKASNIKYLSESGSQEYAWTTSWGVSTRLIGGLVMTHSDDDGLVLPPRLAPTQVVILPVLHKEEERARVLEYCDSLKEELSKKSYMGLPIRVEIDKRDIRGGEKVWGWIKKGVPVRVEVGPRDVAQNAVFAARRDDGSKKSVGREEFVETIADTLKSIQDSMFERAKKYRDENTVEISSKDEFYYFFTPKNPKKPEIHGGFAVAYYDGSREVEEMLKSDLKVTVRCIPLEGGSEGGKCIFTGKSGAGVVKAVFAKSY